VPTSLQYPLERQRELQRRWNRLLQRTAAPKDYSVGYLRASRSRPPVDGAHRILPNGAVRQSARATTATG
jgi:hypothetical protein